jgi:nucleoside-diphosphate-sugar epimerase
MSAPRALITGATGFVGAHVARHLGSLGWELHAVVRAESRLDALQQIGAPVRTHVHDGSTGRMLDIVEEARPSVVFHLASNFLAEHTAADVAGLIESNVLLGTQLAEAMAAHGASRLVNTGTAWQHMHDAGYEPVCLYAATKQAYDALLEYYVVAGSLRVVTLKLFDTYGPLDPRPKLLAALRAAAREGRPLVMSEGLQQLDLVHVRDVVRAFELAAARLIAGDVRGHERYGVSSGRTLTLRELVALYARVSGRPLAVQWCGRPYRGREVMRPWSQAPVLPGWSAAVPLEEGLADLLALEPLEP